MNVLRGGGVAGSAGIPFYASRLEDVSQNSGRILTVTTAIYSATGGAFTVRVLGALGDTLLSRAYPFAGTAVTKAMADSAVASTLASYRGDPSRNRPPHAPADVVSELESKMRAAMPAVTAPLRDVRIGLDNSIWLLLPRGGPSTGRRYLVLDERGEPWRTITLPPRVRYISQATRTSIWAVEWDADGLSTIVRFRVTP